MTHARKGVRIALSPARKMIIELLHHARRVPSLPLGRALDVSAVAAARHAAEPSPSWVAIFMKAYGLVARQHPELRRAYLPYPWPHLYEHPCSVCVIPVECEHEGETVVLPAKFSRPEERALTELADSMCRVREASALGIGTFRQVLRLARLPGPLRRLAFSLALYWSGNLRAKRFGTFNLSSLGNLGVEQFHPLTPLTTYLTFGPIQPPGEVVAKVVYDHRVMDGRVGARCLADLEAVLNSDILSELRTLRQPSRELARSGKKLEKNVADPLKPAAEPLH